MPYVSYLRAYEPTERRTAQGSGGNATDTPLDTSTVTLAQEQQTVLSRTIAPFGSLRGDDLAGRYVLEREGLFYTCPIDLALRSWLALATFVEDTDTATQHLLQVPDPQRRGDVADRVWEQSLVRAVPHIRSATWGVPRTWFLLVTEAEREMYDNGGSTSVRFRTSMSQARARLAEASGLLGALIGDEELMDELDDLQAWLTSFGVDGCLEVDYAGVAGLLGEALSADTSASEIQDAIDALRRKDFAAAGDAYGAFTTRWRVVNALERAN